MRKKVKRVHLNTLHFFSLLNGVPVVTIRKNEGQGDKP